MLSILTSFRFITRDGYPDSENTWEPAASLKKDMDAASFKRLVAVYLKK
jgi:hypothetical protein